ncbi:MAG TPA: cytochrome c-type biogenesis protein CcmH, partial [Gemmatimonadales bacterium]|nr:cytochrome c-type biogenesis protein CcmH [Gemmatimonadales bacterium]
QGGPADQHYDPTILERRDAIVSETANDATVKAAELKLACPCPCTLDVFTCRTTDFTCSYSPERHREVVALVEGQHMNVDQVLAAMVDKYGQEALMAPPERGFNIVGYVFPASVILGLAAVITAILAVKQRNLPAEAAVASSAGPGALSPEDVARVEAELRELES